MNKYLFLFLAALSGCGSEPEQPAPSAEVVAEPAQPAPATPVEPQAPSADVVFGSVHPASVAPLPDAATAPAPPPDKPRVLEITVPETLSPELQALAKSAWPKVRKACKGLDKYAESLQFKDISKQFRLAITFKIPESDAGIPADYMAHGHTCYFELTDDGKNVYIAKDACKSVCLDRSVESDAYLILPLKP